MERMRDRILDFLKERRQTIIDGGINCIPNPFLRFRREWPGIERGKYICVTGSTKSGKTQFTDEVFVYNSVKYAMDNPDKLKLKIFYFTLEMSEEDKYQQFMCNVLFTSSKFKDRVSPMDLRSTDASRPVKLELLDRLETKANDKLLTFFEKTVTFIDDLTTPSKILNFIENQCLKRGTISDKIVETVDTNTGEVTTEVLRGYYEPNDPDEYVLCIVDHVSLVEPEGGDDLRKAMAKLSKGLNNLRNKYKITAIAIQQQAADKEGLDAFKAGKLKPSTDGLADNKAIARDYVIMFGIFSPFKHDYKEYGGYDIGFFRDNIRFVEIIINREGAAGSTCSLLFDGAVNYFAELPKLQDVVAMSKAKEFIREYIRCEKMSAFFSYEKTKKRSISNSLTSKLKRYGYYLRNIWREWRR